MRERTGKIIDKSVLLAGTIGLLGNQNKWPDWWSTYLGKHSWLLVLILGFAGFFGAITPAEAIANRSRADHRARLQRQLLTGLGEFINLARAIRPEVDLDDVGLHTWRVKRSVRHPSGVLKRTGTYRLGGGLQTVGQFAPKKGKGVVGLCWKYNQDKSCNVERLTRSLPTPVEFESCRQLDGDAVMNFSWQEFQSVSHRGAVFAAPIRSGGRFVGCFSVDCSRGYDELVQGGLVQRLNTLTQSFDGRDLGML